MFSGSNKSEAGSDGIGDATHIIDINNQDNFPLMAPISVFDVGAWDGEPSVVEIVSNATISNSQLNATQKNLSFNVSDKAGSGFCRVTIPNVVVQDLWGGNYTVQVDGESPSNIRNWIGNIYAYIYFTYPRPEHKVIIIPEFPLAKLLPLLTVISIIAATIAKRKFARFTTSNLNIISPLLLTVNQGLMLGYVNTSCDHTHFNYFFQHAFFTKVIK